MFSMIRLVRSGGAGQASVNSQMTMARSPLLFSIQSSLFSVIRVPGRQQLPAAGGDQVIIGKVVHGSVLMIIVG